MANSRNVVIALRKRVSAMSLAVLTTLICSGCIAHRSGFEGTVVDLETGKPIEGAIVLAHWRLKIQIMETQDGGAIQLMETVTDRDGRFHFPSWTKFYSPTRGVMEQLQDPEVLIFKQGYRFKRARNFSLSDERLAGAPHLDAESVVEDVRPSEWNGRQFRIGPLRDSKNRADSAEVALDYLNLSIFDWRGKKQCYWAHAAKMYLATSDEYVKNGGKERHSSPSTVHERHDEIVECGQGHLFGME